MIISLADAISTRAQPLHCPSITCHGYVSTYEVLGSQFPYPYRVLRQHRSFSEKRILPIELPLFVLKASSQSFRLSAAALLPVMHQLTPSHIHQFPCPCAFVAAHLAFISRTCWSIIYHLEYRLQTTLKPAGQREYRSLVSTRTRDININGDRRDASPYLIRQSLY